MPKPTSMLREAATRYAVIFVHHGFFFPLGPISNKFLVSTVNTRQSSSMSEHDIPDGTERTKGARWQPLPAVQEPSRALLPIIAPSPISDPDGTDCGGVSALKWVRSCCPGLPVSLIHRLFRKGLIRSQHLDVSASERCGSRADARPSPRLLKVRGSSRLQAGDVLCIPRGVDLSRPGRSDAARPTGNGNALCPADCGMRLSRMLLYEDEHLLVVNKPPGLACQGGTKVGLSLDSLLQAAFASPSPTKPCLVHRLDKDASGAMLVAKSSNAASTLGALFRSSAAEACARQGGGPAANEVSSVRGGIHKRYWALVIGVPQPPSGVIKAPLLKALKAGKEVMAAGRGPQGVEGARLRSGQASGAEASAGRDRGGRASLRMGRGRQCCSDEGGEEDEEDVGEEELERLGLLAGERARGTAMAAAAVTAYRVLCRVCLPGGSGELALLELRPGTGRKHQLRVHCSAMLGTPILGDFKYGAWAHKHLLRSMPEAWPSHALPLHLHSHSVSFPKLGWRKQGAATVHATLPEHFQETLQSIGINPKEFE